MITVPWVISWSGETRFEVRNCRWASHNPAIWQSHAPGEGRPLFTKPHHVRQRRAIQQCLCSVCGEPTSRRDRYWFQHCEWHAPSKGWRVVEPPLHSACAEIARAQCPRLKSMNAEAVEMFEIDVIQLSLIGGEQVRKDFGINVPKDRGVVGSLYYWLPEHRVIGDKGASK